jgi:pimeloyl-ACP methyl ester carboxylesterase
LAFVAAFAPDPDESCLELLAATQRPIAQTALESRQGERPLWRAVPSSFVHGDRDLNIPTAALRAMAERAGARRTVELAGASHALAVSRPAETAEVILQAAADAVT